MKDKVILLTCVCFVVAVMVILAIAFAANQIPLDGYINSKVTHPEYYPNYPNTPTVYCLGITSHNGQMAVSWRVSKEVYDSYEIGDLAGYPSNVKGGTK